TCWSTFQDPLCDAFADSAKATGLAWNDDFNDGINDGVGRIQNTIRDGRRCSTAVAYLRPALDRDNLTVETHALASRLLLEGPRATGVEYRKGGATVTAQAARE